MKKFIPTILILVLIACAKEHASMSPMATRDDKAVYTAATPQQAGLAKLPELQRMIIRSANVSMIVDDTSAAIEKITAAAESVGGYVSDSKVWRDGEQLRGAITLRIPADRLSAALMVIRKLAVRIQSETIGSQEVTQ